MYIYREELFNSKLQGEGVAGGVYDGEDVLSVGRGEGPLVNVGGLAKVAAVKVPPYGSAWRAVGKVEYDRAHATVKLAGKFKVAPVFGADELHDSPVLHSYGGILRMMLFIVPFHCRRQQEKPVLAVMIRTWGRVHGRFR